MNVIFTTDVRPCKHAGNSVYPNLHITFHVQQADPVIYCMCHCFVTYIQSERTSLSFSTLLASTTFPHVFVARSGCRTSERTDVRLGISMLSCLPHLFQSFPSEDSLWFSRQSCRRKPSLGPISLFCRIMARAVWTSMFCRSIRQAITKVGERLQPSLQWTQTLPTEEKRYRC